MLRVIIAGGNENENLLIERKLSPITRSLGEVKFLGARPSHLTTVLGSSYSLLIYNCHHFSSTMRSQIQEFRASGYLGPIMILGKVAHPTAIDRISDLRNVTVIEKPYTNKDIQGIATKYLNDAVVEQRRFRRFDTSQHVVMESYNRELQTKSLITNISQGGAYVCGDLLDLTRGDLLRVSFELDQLNRKRTVSAEVVWTKGEVGTPERAAGLRFIPKGKVYETLLNGFS